MSRLNRGNRAKRARSEARAISGNVVARSTVFGCVHRHVAVLKIAYNVSSIVLGVASVARRPSDAREVTVAAAAAAVATRTRARLRGKADYIA